ncbi:DUF2497 domain-containing protein [Pedomonas mirosovicensis]|uniref:DUF2497 domain-containing protein n=1 Tax=Pedomonas mirosovicensis TaxID=2908641 RepID=UPI002169B2D0|nr:DUF2497 domain-containing protein [Pedomonas mirosovicensis]MCH8685174.1 DUF2497 domain-containing protein [Pedomonas mirosovicensis]
MADSKEPTMEEILASIRRIISEEGEAAPAEAQAPRPEVEAAPQPQPQPAAQEAVDEFFDEAFEEAEDEDVLELTDTVEAPVAQKPEPEGPSLMDEGLISEQTVAATTQKLNTLSGLLVRNYPGSENTLEGLVREMLRPMLKEWLDANLPEIVERTVAREVARITGRVAGE